MSTGRSYFGLEVREEKTLGWKIIPAISHDLAGRGATWAEYSRANETDTGLDNAIAR